MLGPGALRCNRRLQQNHPGVVHFFASTAARINEFLTAAAGEMIVPLYRCHDVPEPESEGSFTQVLLNFTPYGFL